MINKNRFRVDTIEIDDLHFLDEKESICDITKKPCVLYLRESDGEPSPINEDGERCPKYVIRIHEYSAIGENNPNADFLFYINKMSLKF